ncbi:type I secretion system permease/ATPase [Pseudomonas aeruginosa]|uniref:Type I secretion system permease/ATPase n=6 Tax=Pseudomonas aeruginosa TaxID=287 RepID=A0A8G4NTG3_PSEAI|nr:MULTISPECIES: alkaline protease secretion ATP-binding protein AprD [Pseudomonas]KFB19600.1 peptidase [Pseudomonas aeruginosa PGPR2]MED5478770.1 alkaline protease secretion ATP-binding protein AprD [Pseudomonadota bacterium]SSV37769.1 protein secretion efflux system ABC transporter ATP-binding/membrane protein [Acinetobacter baumannii]HCL2748534.1 type I secretion system permease/ATPase [Pseudomonas aeruginosa 449A]AHC66710.1 peptidase [Pseudomonas aeruginosa LES431]
MARLGSSVTNEIKQALAASRGALRSVAAFSGVINLLMLVPSLYMLQVYDRVLSSANEVTLLMLTLMALGVFVFMGALEALRSFVLVRVSERFDGQLHGRIYAAAFERNLRAGGQEASQALHDLTTLRQFITGQALFAFFDAPWFPVYLLVIFLFDPWLGLLSLVGALALMALAWFNERATRAPLAKAGELSIKSGQLASNNLRNAEVIEAMGMLGSMRGRWERLHQAFLDQQSLASERAARINALSKYLRIALQSLVLGLGAWLAVEGRITPGMMIAGSILMGRALGPIDQLIGVWKQWGAARDAYRRLSGLLDEFPARERRMELPEPRGHLLLESLDAAPPGSEARTLRGLTLAIPAGSVVGVIGPSGSGKSSLARVVLGIWPTLHGSVRLDGAEIRQYERETLGPRIGYLPQDIELFAGTVAENIARFGEVQADKVVEAARLAGVHELVLRLPQGYDTVLGVGGAGLSGGQRQRIALARALYGAPTLVVLDEPNSNLDDSGEQALLAAIQALKARSCTVLLITHRAGVLGCADRLLALNAGQLHLYGERDQVLAALNNQRAASASQQRADYRVAGYGAPQVVAAPRQGGVE